MGRTRRTRPGDKTDKRPAELPLPSAKKSTNPSEDASLSIQDTPYLSPQAEPILLSEGNINLLSSNISTPYEARQMHFGRVRWKVTDQENRPALRYFHQPRDPTKPTTFATCQSRSPSSPHAQTVPTASTTTQAQIHTAHFLCSFLFSLHILIRSFTHPYSMSSHSYTPTPLYHLGLGGWGSRGEEPKPCSQQLRSCHLGVGPLGSA